MLIGRYLKAVLFIALLQGLLLPLPVLAEWHRQAFQTLGTQAYIELWESDSAKAQQLISEVQAEFERINQAMSPYIASSELSKLNAEAAKHKVVVSAEMYSLLQRAAEISQISNGAFDITFASVGFYYDYRARKKPTTEEQHLATELINYKAVELLPNNAVRYAKQGVKVDLGGIAKGYAVERAMAKLVAAGVKYAQLTAGGDSRLLGDKNGMPWIVGIKHPRQDNKFAAQLPLQDTAISTSGDYERFFIENGTRYHHIIDPTTGSSAKGALSVTVIGPDTTTTDALSTTLFVQGLTRGLELIEQIDGYEAIFIDADHRMYFSSGLSQ